MKSLNEALHLVAEHGYSVKYLTGINPFSEKQKNHFLLKQVLMQIATCVGEIATLSEPSEKAEEEIEIQLKNATLMLFTNTLRLANIQKLNEEDFFLKIPQLLKKS